MALLVSRGCAVASKALRKYRNRFYRSLRISFDCAPYTNSEKMPFFRDLSQ